jgi:hypothetical protein
MKGRAAAFVGPAVWAAGVLTATPAASQEANANSTFAGLYLAPYAVTSVGVNSRFSGFEARWPLGLSGNQSFVSAPWSAFNLGLTTKVQPYSVALQPDGCGLPCADATRTTPLLRGTATFSAGGTSLFVGGGLALIPNNDPYLGYTQSLAEKSAIIVGIEHRFNSFGVQAGYQRSDCTASSAFLPTNFVNQEVFVKVSLWDSIFGPKGDTPPPDKFDQGGACGGFGTSPR